MNINTRIPLRLFISLIFLIICLINKFVNRVCGQSQNGI